MDRDKQIALRLTSAEYDKIKSDASEVGMNVSDYVRSSVLKKMTRVFYDPEVDEILREVSEYSRTSAAALQELARKDDESFSSTVAFRTASDEIRRMNVKLAVMREALNEIKETLMHGNNEATENQGE